MSIVKQPIRTEIKITSKARRSLGVTLFHPSFQLKKMSVFFKERGFGSDEEDQLFGWNAKR
jgi:hypothetical protein